MNPRTEGLEEQGPNRIPFINDPDKGKPPIERDDEVNEEAEAEEEEGEQ